MQTDRPLWDVAATVASAFATVAVALFAGVQLWREYRRQKNAEKTAVSAVSALAYLLRRRLKSWLGPNEGDEDFLEEWLRDQRNAKTYDREIAAGERDFRELMALLADVPEFTAAAARDAYLFYLEGVRLLREYAEAGRPERIGFFAWIQKRHDAAADLRACKASLERGVIEVALLNTETSLRRKREEEDTLHQLGMSLAAKLEEDESPVIEP
jgi:hypothetical protein